MSGAPKISYNLRSWPVHYLALCLSPIWLLMKFYDRFLMCQEPGSVEFNIVSAVIVSKRKSIWDFFCTKKNSFFPQELFFCRYFKIILTCRYHKYWLLDDGNKSESRHVLTVFVIFLEYLQEIDLHGISLKNTWCNFFHR